MLPTCLDETCGPSVPSPSLHSTHNDDDDPRSSSTCLSVVALAESSSRDRVRPDALERSSSVSRRRDEDEDDVEARERYTTNGFTTIGGDRRDDRENDAEEASGAIELVATNGRRRRARRREEDPREDDDDGAACVTKGDDEDSRTRAALYACCLRTGSVGEEEDDDVRPLCCGDVPRDEVSDLESGTTRRTGRRGRGRYFRQSELSGSTSNAWLSRMVRSKGSSTEFVLSGYRPSEMSWRSCSASVFSIHNETINIWTHACGAIAWAFAMDAATAMLRERARNLSEQTMYVTKACYLMCLAMPVASSLFHTYNCMGERAYRTLLRLDILGIHTLMFARTMTEAYLVYFCEPTTWITFMILAAVIGGGLAAHGAWNLSQWPFVPQLALAHVPLISFLGAGERAGDAFRDDVVVDVDATAVSFDPRERAYVELSLYGSLVGVVAFGLYRSRFPERLWPGRFDIVGSSHQWWHVFTWIGPSLVLAGMLELTMHRHQRGACVSAA